MKKMLPLLMVGILVISGIGAVALQEKDNETIFKKETFNISEPIITEKGEFLEIDLEESSSNIIETGKPILPIITKTFTFPLRTRIVDVNVDFEIKEKILQKKILPSPKPVPLTNDFSIEEIIMDEETYSSSNLYPEKSYSIRKGVGLHNGENVIFVNIQVTPQYSPSENILYLPRGNINFEVEHINPKTPYFTGLDEIDMVIITPQEFEEKLQRLVDHKNSVGINSIIKTTEDIYSEYPEGRDEPEKIKLYIYDMKETNNIKYVLLAGGRKGQSFDWHVPERITNNDDGWEAGYSSDLYYGDIYKLDGEAGIIFEDWDTNENGVFAEWSGFVGRSDVPIDYYPDVTVGRIPFRTLSDIDPVIDKIITYETTTTNEDSWFKKGIVISGDTFPPQRGGAPGWYEGEMETGVTVDLLEGIGIEVEKLWLSLEAWDDSTDVINALSGGAGFVHFAGHGNPAAWGNHPADDAKGDDKKYIDGLTIFEMNKIKNGNQLPVVVVGGCHNAQFNVTMSNIITGILEYGIMGYFFRSPMRFYYMEWVPRDWSSMLLLMKGGGSIASIGCSGLGYGYINEYALAGLGGWIDSRFFDAYANQSKTYVGEAHDQAITDYINIIGHVNSDQIDRKTIEEWTLIGDPSLKLGGV